MYYIIITNVNAVRCYNDVSVTFEAFVIGKERWSFDLLRSRARIEVRRQKWIRSWSTMFLITFRFMTMDTIIIVSLRSKVREKNIAWLGRRYYYSSTEVEELRLIRSTRITITPNIQVYRLLFLDILSIIYKLLMLS